MDESVFQIISDKYAIDYQIPTNELFYINSMSGSGFVIEFEKKKLIVTNSHVANNGYVYMRKNRQSDLLKINLFAEFGDFDISLFELEDKKQEKFLKPIPIANEIKIGEKIFTYGFPFGKRNMYFGRGIINRIERLLYTPTTMGFVINIDAVVNGGNSGGPTLNKSGELIGIIFAGLKGSDTNYSIPFLILKQFLKRIYMKIKTNNFEIGHYSYGYTGSVLDVVNDKNLLEYYNQKKPGVIVLDKIKPNPLSIGDRLIKINGMDITFDGYIKIPELDYNEVKLNNYINILIPGEKVKITVVRFKKQIELEITLQPIELLIEYNKHKISKKIIFYGGLVFTILNIILIDFNVHQGLNVHHLVHQYGRIKYRKDDKEIIILSFVFNTEITEPFLKYKNLILKKVEDEKVHNMDHLYQLIRKYSKKKYIIFHLKPDKKIILPTKKAAIITKNIMKSFNIDKFYHDFRKDELVLVN